MASTSGFVEGETVRGGFTIMTHVVPSQSAPVETGFEFPAPAPASSHSHPNSWREMVKGEPKALGTVQIMIGVIIILFGIVITSVHDTSLTHTGVIIWAPFFYIVSGALSVASAAQNNTCIVKACLVINIISATVAGVAMILMSAYTIDSIEFYKSRSNWNRGGYFDVQQMLERHYIGIIAILLVLTFLQFIVCLCVSGFTCKASCCKARTQVVVGTPDALNRPLKHLPA